MRLPVLAVAVLPLLAACQTLAGPGGSAAAPPTSALSLRAPSPSDVAAASIPPLQDTRTYLCSDGTVVRASYANNDSSMLDFMRPTGSAVLRINGDRIRMLQGASASGDRYIGGGYEWTTRGLRLANLAPLGEGGAPGSSEGVACRSNG